MSKPILYIKQGCPWCNEALAAFESKKIEIEVVDVRTNPSRMNELVEVSGQNKTPTLLNDRFVVADFDMEEFDSAMKQNPEEAKKIGWNKN